MKKCILKYAFSAVISGIVICCIIIFIYVKCKNEIIKVELMKKADEIVKENIVTEIDLSSNKNNDKIQENKIESTENNTIYGKIKIPKINVEAPIKEGTTPDVLKYSVGHFTNTNYWNGNVGLASHNRGTYAHYFQNINKLNLNDEIIYQTKFGTRIYKVDAIEKIQEEDLSVLNESSKNTITLITCVKDNKKLRLCVKAIEKV